MLIGYNTNGMAHHDLMDALELLSATGYRSVALTIDHGFLSPRDPRTAVELQRVKHWLLENKMANVIETGARFLLDPRHKHAPTLLDADKDRVQARVDLQVLY